MAIFEEITLEWRGEKKAVPPERVMKAIAVVEEVISLQELTREMLRGDHRLVRIAEAYGALLRHVGFSVADEAVYEAIFPSAGGENLLRASAALQTLLYMMIPPSVRKAPPAAAAEAAPPGKQPAAS